MSTTTPAGWYPDPKPTDPANPGQRWWNGTEWTVSTKTDAVAAIGPSDAPPSAPPGLPPYTSAAAPAKRSRPRRATVLAGAIAALLGLGAGSLTTYLIMDNRHTDTAPVSAKRFGNGGLGGSGGLGGGNSNGGSTGGNGSTGGGGGLGSSTTTAYDLLDGVSLPIPSGWKGGTTQDGHASLLVGSYTCAQSKSGCSLGGANTETLKASVSAGAQAAAEADITAAVKEAYGEITGHQQLKAESVTVAGRSGYLIRWQVDAKVGNSGTVETVVFPTKDGKSLVALHMGFDKADKAPDVSVMDTIVSGIQDVDTASLSGGAIGGSTGSNS